MALRTLVLTLACALVATVGFAAGEEEAPATAMEMVTDPTTGEVVVAPEYGGTLTVGYKTIVSDMDPYFGPIVSQLTNVMEKLCNGNWGIDRDEWDHASGPTPLSAMTGRLAESWETPDNTTLVFHIRDGVRWHNKAPMNGRELTAHDIEFNFHRMFGLGDFAEAGPSTYPGAAGLVAVPLESVTATDDSTVVMKLKEPYLPALGFILLDVQAYIMPPEVIEQHGDVQDWRNVVGTGPFMLTEFVEESSFTSPLMSGPKRSRRAIGTTRNVPRSSSMTLGIRAARTARDSRLSGTTGSGEIWAMQKLRSLTSTRSASMLRLTYLSTLTSSRG